MNPHPVHLKVINTNTKVKNQSTSCPSLNLPTQTLRTGTNQHIVHLLVTNRKTKVKNQSTCCQFPSQQHKGHGLIHILSISKSPTQTLRTRINPQTVHLQVINTNTKVKNQSTSCPSPSHQHKNSSKESINIMSISKSPTQTLRSRLNPYPVHQVIKANTKVKKH